MDVDFVFEMKVVYSAPFLKLCCIQHFRSMQNLLKNICQERSMHASMWLWSSVGLLEQNFLNKQNMSMLMVVFFLLKNHIAYGQCPDLEGDRAIEENTIAPVFNLVKKALAHVKSYCRA